ncbi:MAG: hypothetical protein HY901_09105 [Deltaproteobacteria bacterium]|nr:hypothetical protein [Deltaproteobacteria bacterium]
MTPICPRCGSVDVYSSRAKGAGETFARLLGLPPRRCSACGWRGFRPRIIFPARRGSSPDNPVLASPEVPPPVPPMAASDPGSRRSKRRHHPRHHQHRIKHRGTGGKLVALALALGVAAGLMAYACSG